jgi:molybdopterin synthase catalytic subunit
MQARLMIQSIKREFMIKIDISFFATIRAIIGEKRIQMEIPEGSTISDLKKILARKYPEAQDAFPGMLTSINRVFSQDHDLIPEDAEVAFFPHIAGGRRAGSGE